MKKVIRTNKAAIKQAIDLLHANANKILVWHAPKSRFFTSCTTVGAEVYSTIRNLSIKSINELKFQDRFGNAIEFEEV